MWMNWLLTGKEQLDTILDQSWHRWIEGDSVRAIKDAANHEGTRQTTPGWAILQRHSRDHILQPDELIEALKLGNSLTPGAETLITDYCHYLQHRTHRRPEIWHNKHEWHKFFE